VLRWVRSMLLPDVSVLISCRILIDKVVELSQMSERATWKRILENEQEKIKIQEIFKQIDEHTKNFHVRCLYVSHLINQHYVDSTFLSSDSC